MHDQVDDSLLGSVRHSCAQDGLANAAPHVGMWVDDKDHIVPHDISDIRCALLNRDARLTRILRMDDKGPRIPNGPNLAFSPRLSFGSLDDDLALMNDL